MKTKIKINREQVLDKLKDFASAGSGMVIGIPGIGKSHLLQQLKNRLVKEGTLSFLFKIENTPDYTDQSIAEELGLLPNDNWIDILNSIEYNGISKAVLIFDGFDAVRDEKKRQGFLEQIKKAKNRLEDKWNIVISVRTYDAEKSTELIRMFSNHKLNSSFETTRKFTIDKLNDDEISDLITNNHPEYQPIFENGSKEIKEIIRVPFFLNLFNFIVFENNDIKSIEQLSLIKYETQLLDLYWKKNIDEHPDSILKQKFLIYFTNTLVQEKTLTLSKTNVLRNLDSQSFSPFDVLLRENYLTEVSINKNRIGFSHNILFDYAVSRICWDYNYDSIIEFINQDISRAFFLRPSFNYTFSTIWSQDFTAFSKIYSLFQSNTEIPIKLFFKLIINSTIASHYENTEQLSHLLASKTKKDFIDKVKDLLQSLRFIRKQTYNKDIDLLLFLSKDLNPEFLYEYSFILEKAIENEQYRNDDRCGISARSFLTYVLDKRKGENQAYFDRIGSTKGVNLVVKTIKTNIEKTTFLIYEILDLIEKDNFEIQYFFNLTNLISYVIDAEPKVAKAIYEKVYLHNETSREKTNMGGSTVMSFISNRRQDFELCQYNLEKDYPEFLNKSEFIALETGINIVNQRVLIDELGHINAKSIETKIENHLLRLEHTIITDYSYIWAGNSYSGVERITNSIISYIVELLQQKEVIKAQELVKSFMHQAKVAYLWKNLFKICADFPVELLELVTPIIIHPFTLSTLDLTFDVRNLLENAASLIPDKDLERIENLIFEYYETEGYEPIINVLSSLPSDRLQTQDAKEYISKNEKKVNEKLVTFSSSSSTYTIEDYLKDKGVDTAKNSGLISKINSLENFCSNYLNAKPDIQLYKPFLIESFKLWDILVNKPNLDVELAYQIRYSVTSTLAICARNLDGLTESDYNKLKEIIIENYYFYSEYDTEKELSAGSGYSSTPRIFASDSFLPIIKQRNDDTILLLFYLALNDKNSIVRLNCIKDIKSFYRTNFGFYKDILIHSLKIESNAFNYSVAISNIVYNTDNEQLNFSELLDIINKQPKNLLNNSQFTVAYSVLLLNLFQISNSPEIKHYLFSAYDNFSLAKNNIFNLFKTIDPHNESEYALTHRKLEIINHYIERAFNDLKDLDIKNNASPEEVNAFMIIDQVIMRLHFSFVGRNTNMGSILPLVITDNSTTIYNLIKPTISLVIEKSTELGNDGIIQGHTAHYLMQTLNAFLSTDPKNILSMVAKVTQSAFNSGYTFDQLAIKEIVSITEKLLADHRDLLLEEDSFNDLITIFDIHLKSGWIDVLQLLWRMDEIFK